MSATSIDEVITCVDAILERTVAAGDRRGYFAALYKRVMLRVRDGLQQGEFEDVARMERLDVIFANRYLDAYDGYAQGAPVPRVWRRAFDAARRDGLLVVQHLLLGMNAHITLDLGIAAAAAAPGAELDQLKGDFDKINDVLASLVGTVEDELITIVGRWEPPAGSALRIAERVCGGRERTAMSLLIDGARAAAWHFARELVQLDPDEARARVRHQDEAAVLLSDTLLLGSGIAPAGDVAADIRILAQGELPP
jgi:hypothetical protein